MDLDFNCKGKPHSSLLFCCPRAARTPSYRSLLFRHGQEFRTRPRGMNGRRRGFLQRRRWPSSTARCRKGANARTAERERSRNTVTYELVIRHGGSQNEGARWRGRVEGGGYSYDALAERREHAVPLFQANQKWWFYERHACGRDELFVTEMWSRRDDYLRFVHRRTRVTPYV